MWGMFDWQSSSFDTRSEQFTPSVVLRMRDSKPWIQVVRVLLRGHVSALYSSTERMVAFEDVIMQL